MIVALIAIVLERHEVFKRLTRQQFHAIAIAVEKLVPGKIKTLVGGA